MKTIPKEMMKARAFLMKPNLSLFLAGLGRLDYIEGLERIRVVVFSSIELPVTLIETKFANEFYEEFLGSEVLGVPILENEERIQAWPRLEASEEFTVKGIDKHLTVCDVVLSSAGWVGVNLPSNETGTFQAWTPQKRGIYIRQPSLLPYGMNLRGSRVPKSLAYHIGKSFTYRKVQYNSFKNTRNQRN
jgi:nitric oxide-associated protein 1